MLPAASVNGSAVLTSSLPFEPSPLTVVQPSIASALGLVMREVWSVASALMKGCDAEEDGQRFVIDSTIRREISIIAAMSLFCVMFALFVPSHGQMRDSDEDGSEELVDSTADDSTYVDDSVDDTAGSDVSDENTQDTGNSDYYDEA